MTGRREGIFDWMAYSQEVYSALFACSSKSNVEAREWFIALFSAKLRHIHPRCATQTILSLWQASVHVVIKLRFVVAKRSDGEQQ